MKLDVIINDVGDQQNIVGVKNRNLKLLEECFNCKIDIRGNVVYADCDEHTGYLLEEILKVLLKVSRENYQINERDIIYIHKLTEAGRVQEILSLYSNPKMVGKKFGGKQIVAKTLNQRLYIDNLMNKDIVFGVGPAGTGKTYLAVAYAVNMLKDGNVKKLILTRPAVEAGESLGYLPGDLKEKIDPYLRPLYDALYDTLGVEATNSLIEKEVIEIAPLAYMRGRTLENACVILDEAQNTTTKQMKMFLTRLGFRTKMIITGDDSQIDLPRGVKSGLVEVVNMLKDIEEIGVTEFSKEDVVRHPLVAKILSKYEEMEGR